MSSNTTCDECGASIPKIGDIGLPIGWTVIIAYGKGPFDAKRRDICPRHIVRIDRAKTRRAR